MDIKIKSTLSKSKGHATISGAAIGRAEKIDPNFGSPNQVWSTDLDEAVVEITVHETTGRSMGRGVSERWTIVAEEGASDSISYRPGSQAVVVEIIGGRVVR